MPLYIPNGGSSGVYENRIFSAVDEYKTEYGFSNDDIIENPALINNMLMFIYDTEIKPNISEYRTIEQIDNLFNAYVSICSFYRYRPNINTFIQWLHISKKVYTSLCNGSRNIYISENGDFIYNIKEYKLLYPANKYYILCNSGDSIIIDICKRWAEVCESFLVDGLVNARGNPVGAIFALKSIYGYSETKQAETETEKIGSRSAEQIAVDYSGIISNCADQKNNLPALP